MDQESLSGILRARYGLKEPVPALLREGGGQTYLVRDGADRFFLKAIGTAFASTARQSVSIMRALAERDFPAPKIIPTRDGELLPAVSADGEERLIVLQEYVEGEEPDLTARAHEVGRLTGRLHVLLESIPAVHPVRGAAFFIGRYLDFLKRKAYPRLREYETLGESLWEKVREQPATVCHGDLHRGNLLETADGRIFVLDFDTVCRAPAMFDVSVMCDMTDYFRLKQEDVSTTFDVYERFLEGYSEFRTLSPAERGSLRDWIAIRHFQLQATILEIHGIDCVGEQFIDAQIKWMERWNSG